MRKTITALSLAALLTGAASAEAAPARNGGLAAAGAEYKWDGTPLNGVALTAEVGDAVGCTPGLQECDDTLLKVDSAGSLAVKITGDGGPATVDLDLYVYASGADGAPGKLLKSSTGGTADESTTLEAEPGYYLVRVSAATAANGGYKGVAALAAPSEAETTAQPLMTPAPNAAPKTTVTRPKGKKITAIKGTATDDSKVAKVAVGLVQVKGKTCYGLTTKGTFTKLKKCSAPTLLTAKGTSAWTLKLKKPLKKGKYVVYATATDDKNLSEGGYGAANKVAFTVK